MWRPWCLLVGDLIKQRPNDVVYHYLVMRAHSPPASISGSFCKETTPRSGKLAVKVLGVAYSLSGITPSDLVSGCPGLSKTNVRVPPPEDEERFMEKAKPPPPGIGVGRSRAESGLSPDQY